MPYQQITLPQLRSYFYEQVDQNTAFFRTDEVNRILQESLRVFNCLTGFWRGRIDMSPTVAGQHFYPTPAGMTYPLRAEVNQKTLGSSSLWDLDYGQPTWENDICRPGDLPQLFAPAGVNLFALWPASFGGGESLVVEGVVSAPVLFDTLPAPAAIPTVVNQPGLGTLPGGTLYFIVFTWVGNGGESPPSPGAANFLVAPGALSITPSGTPPIGATGFNVYIDPVLANVRLQATRNGYATYSQNVPLVAGPLPPALGTPSTIDLGQDELETILDYAEHVAQFKEGGQEAQAGQLLLKEFLKECGERNAVLMQSSRFRNWMGLSDQKKRPMRIPDDRVGAR